MSLTLSLLFSYLIGSIPSAYILGKITKGVDVRKYGSGNIGATNAFRVLGPYIGIAVLILDIIKGIVPVVFIADYAANSSYFNPLLLSILLGGCAVLGHTFTVFLKFKGGKGIATTLGVLIGLSIKLPVLKIVLLCEIGLWLATFLISRIVSLSSIISAVFFPIFFIFFRQPPMFVLVSACLSIIVIIRHNPNIIRLLQHKEPRLNLHKSG